MFLIRLAFAAACALIGVAVARSLGYEADEVFSLPFSGGRVDWQAGVIVGVFAVVGLELADRVWPKDRD